MTLLKNLANLCLLVFALSGVAGVLDELIHAAIDWHLLTVVRIPLELVLFTLCMVMAVAMAITPQLPKSVFVPMLGFVCWLMLGTMPVPIYFYGTPWMGLIPAALQLGIAVALFVRVRRIRGGGGWFLDDGCFRGRFFSPLNTAAVIGLPVLLGPPLLAGYVLWSVDLGAQHASAGFVGFSLRGMEITHREYTRGDRTIDLIGMAHIGDPATYDLLFDGIPVADTTIVLEEGVADKDGNLGDGPLYDRMAERLGLVTQRPMSEMTRLKTRNADVDVSRFSPETLTLLQKVMAIYRADNMVPPMLDYVLYTRRHPDQEAMLEQLRYDLVDLRNEHLLEEVDRALEDHTRVVVPWGAYHMSQVEAEILADGFTQVDEVHHTLIRYSTLWN